MRQIALHCPLSLIDSVISNFDSRKPSVGIAESNADKSNIVRIYLPFKDQVSANSVRRQLRDLSNKIGLALQPVFVSKKCFHETSGLSLLLGKPAQREGARTGLRSYARSSTLHYPERPER